jgi:hypothetical protein
MKMLVLIAMVLSAGILLIEPLEAPAHGSDYHGDHMDAQMKKLHAMMPVFSIASAELGSSKKGDFPGAKQLSKRLKKYALHAMTSSVIDPVETYKEVRVWKWQTS